MEAIESLTAALPVVRDVVMTLVAVVGAWVAFSGLSTWKRQLRGKTEYELARRILRGALRIRNRLQSVRSPFFVAAKPGEQHTYEAMKQAFDTRLTQVQEAWTDLETDMLEAEALWGEAAEEAFRKLREGHGELVARVGEYLWVENPNPPPLAMVDRSESRLERLRPVVFCLDPNDDEYGKRLNEAVEDVRNLVRHRLR